MPSRPSDKGLTAAMRAYNRSLEPRLWDIRNLCGVESGLAGWTAVIVAMVLNVLLVIATVAMFTDGVRRRAGPAASRSSTP